MKQQKYPKRRREMKKKKKKKQQDNQRGTEILHEIGNNENLDTNFVDRPSFKILFRNKTRFQIQHLIQSIK